MSNLFNLLKFNGDISKWNTSNVTHMNLMFYNFNSMSDVSQWKPYKLEQCEEMFDECKAPIPYWYSKDAKEVIQKLMMWLKI